MVARLRKLFVHIHPEREKEAGRDGYTVMLMALAKRSQGGKERSRNAASSGVTCRESRKTCAVLREENTGKGL